LLAVGRKVNTERLNLEAAGIDYDRSGIKVDAGLRTRNRRVYAIGDVAGGLQFTHVAGYHAGVVIRSMLFGLPAKAKEEPHSLGDLYGSRTYPSGADRSAGTGTIWRAFGRCPG
jgi:pyruvate/2-oxoglutarate dehydrogenase complex dihydrolipoamide dehydrogenase (E3) component